MWSGLASLPVLSVGLGQELLVPGSLDTGQQEVAVPVELGCPGHGAMWGATLLKLPSRDVQVPGPWLALLGPQTGRGLQMRQEDPRGLCGETPVASGARHHPRYEEDLVGLLHVPPELQQR